MTRMQLCPSIVNLRKSNQNKTIIENGIVKDNVKVHLESIFVYKLKISLKPGFISVPPEYNYVPKTLTINSMSSKEDRFIGATVTSVSPHEVI
jgi:hypothetical protein